MATGFFAYPGSWPIITEAVTAAVEKLEPAGVSLTPWESLRPFGFKLDNLIREKIAGADVLIADITYPNSNVFYEIGYAIGVGKPVVPTINVGIEKSVQRAQTTGIFDTIGWVTYNNSDELAERLKTWPTSAWTSAFVRQKNHAQPLFILDTAVKTDFRNHIFHSVDNSHVQFRSFDPSQNPRLTASHAVSDVSSSSGVIVPIIGTDIIDSVPHNLRAAFILGLCHGFGVEALAIQYANGPAPLDFRDFVTNSTYRHETETHVKRFASEVLIWNQTASSRSSGTDVGILGEIYLGSPTAENETQTLGEYFVKTAEYARALRAEGAVIIGRKGSGKSAVYFQVLEEVARDRRRCTVDLRPASHNLSEMREALFGVVSAGVFDHTIAAFWQYIMYTEIVLRLRELALPRARNDFALQERISKLEDDFNLTDSVVSGDFTSRLGSAVKSVISAVSSLSSESDIRSKLTNLMFEQPIPKLREAIVAFHEFADDITLLIDDLDKGWPPKQVEAHDVTMVKHLIEVLNRIQRDLGKKQITLRHLAFLRSDIYERLVEETSDRGKYNVIKVDWSDPEQLRYLIKQRVTHGLADAEQAAAWAAINPGGDGESGAISRMIESSLRRPRFLIDLCERTLSVAINRGHRSVEATDVDEGLRQMSLYLVSDFGYEMRDIAGTPEDIFYTFIGAPSLLSLQELEVLLKPDKLGLGVEDTIELLLWYGFLGVAERDGKPRFIYDYAYDFRRLEAERSSISGEVVYVVNPAFLLGIDRD